MFCSKWRRETPLRKSKPRSKHKIEIAWLWSTNCEIIKTKTKNQNSIPTNIFSKSFEKKFHEKYISIFGLQSPVIVNKCELNLTAGTSWILPRIPSTTLREEKKNEETKHFENLKLLKGPSRYWKTTYTNEFYKINGKENKTYTFLDNSFYEIGSNSEECLIIFF